MKLKIRYSFRGKSLVLPYQMVENRLVSSIVLLSLMEVAQFYRQDLRKFVTPENILDVLYKFIRILFYC